MMALVSGLLSHETLKLIVDCIHRERAEQQRRPYQRRRPERADANRCGQHLLVERDEEHRVQEHDGAPRRC